MKIIKNILILLVVFSLSACELPHKNQPNIIVILTDDLDIKLMPYLPKTNQLIGEQGASFTNYFITTPLCCPSRASMLRGQYAHNTDIMENSPGFIRFFKLQEEETALPVWLQKAGYQTALIGKYLNNYPTNAGRNYVPPGWNDWQVFMDVKNSRTAYYNYILSENGKLVEYHEAETDYSTDVFKAKSLEFINTNLTANAPFFLLVSTYAPHGPSTPAARHANLFNDLQYPHNPSFHEPDLADKPKVIQALSQTGDDFDAGDANALFQKRAQSVQAVDELVEEIIQTLQVHNALENTYVIFTSDNGFHMGEHGLTSGKGTAYEEDIHVPLLIRGPGIPAGGVIAQMAANIDLAPTIAEMANAAPPSFVDGRSFMPCLRNQKTIWRNGLLLEFGYIRDNEQNSAGGDSETDNALVGVPGGKYRGIRFENYTYVEYSGGEIEFYDLLNDPYQLDNLASQLSAATLTDLHAQLQALQNCAGAECQKLEDNLKIEIK